MDEETMVIQPNGQKKEDKTQQAPNNKKNETMNDKKKQNGSHTGATIAAGVVGAMAGGAATAAAATILHHDDDEAEAEAKDTNEENPTSTTTHEAAEHHDEPEAKEEQENIAINPQDTIPEKGTEASLNGQEQEGQPHVTSTGSESEEVQILGVYEREVDGVHQEMALMTDGEELGAVIDTDGDGEADVLAVDIDHSQSFEENEMLDISDKHIGMDNYEQAYLAQENSDTEDAQILAADENDYTNNNGADPVSEDQSTNDDVQVLGLYEREVDGVHQEMAIVTDGEDVAAVIDVNGNGEADVAVMDIDGSQSIEENEVFDVSDQHVEMNSYEEAYISQQEEMEQMDTDMAEMQQQEMEDNTLAYNASDDQDYNNDVEFYDA